jgi:cobaltochelatase CobS
MNTTNISLSDFIPGAPGTFPGFERDHSLMDFVPEKNEHYQFRPENLRDVLAFLANANGDGLYLSGPTGCGKTSIFLETAARLNWPVRRVNAHSRMELQDIVGAWGIAPVKGGGTATVFRYGPLAKAMKEGSIFILDEIDLLDPSIAAGLNPVLEGNPLVLADNGGEIIRPSSGFRFVATGNTAGMGDDTGAYSGTSQQNLAYMDRFIVVEVGYPSEEVEESILSAIYGDQIDSQVRKNMINLANKVREQFIGTGNSGASLSITFSTRTLIRWCNLLVAYSRSPIAGSRLEYSLSRTLTMRARPHEKEAIHSLAKVIFGNMW